MFDAYGPFELRTHDKDGIDNLYRQISDDGTHNLENGIGIYIIASQDPAGKSVPQYVGRTVDEFGTRLKQHFDKGKFVDLVSTGPLQVFLIARAIKGQIVIKSEATGKDFLLIEQLERDLIAHCVAQNKDLLNIRSRTKQETYVAGFRGDDAAKREPAAQALAKLLGT